MNKFMSFLNEKLVPVTEKITNNRYVKILMDSFMGISALTIGASFFVLARSLPLGDWYTNFLQSTGLYDVLNFPILITSELISLYLIITIGYHVAKSFNKKPINGALIALGAFLMLTPFETTATFTTEAGGNRFFCCLFRITYILFWITGNLPCHDCGYSGHKIICLVRQQRLQDQNC